MKRIILAALVGVLVSGPVWGQEQEYVCSNMKGVSLTLKDGKPKFFEDAFTGTEFIVSIRNDSATVTWRGVISLIDKATVVKGSDDGDDVSFFSNWPSVVRLYSRLENTTNYGDIPIRTRAQTSLKDITPKCGANITGANNILP